MRLQSWEVELPRVASDVLPLSPQMSDPQLATPTPYPQPPRGAPAAWGPRAGTDQVGGLWVSGEEPAGLRAAADLGQGVA